MSAHDTIFAGSIPRLYDTYLVPLISAGFAEDIARRVAALAPTAILETAAGSGVVTRALAPKLAPGARYVATDLNQPMLDHAAERQAADDRVSWRQADALALPFDAAAFDVVCCQFGVMFLPDRVAGYRKAKRVLKPDGRFIFTVWDRIDKNAFANDVTQALAEIFPSDPPRFMARTPHGYHEVSLIHDELERAGFSNITIETRSEESRAPSPHHVAIAYCQGTPLRNEIEARDKEKLQAATEHVATVIASRHGNAEVAAGTQALVVTAAS